MGFHKLNLLDLILNFIRMQLIINEFIRANFRYKKSCNPKGL